MKLFGSKSGIVNFWIGIIAWIGWFILQAYQYKEMHEIVDPSYNPWDDGPLQISLSFQTIFFILPFGAVCLIGFVFGFWSWWHKRQKNKIPYLFDVIGCFLTGGFLFYPFGWFWLLCLSADF